MMYTLVCECGVCGSVRDVELRWVYGVVSVSVLCYRCGKRTCHVVRSVGA